MTTGYDGWHGGVSAARREHGHLDVVRALAAGGGADVNQANANGASPLFVASQEGYADVVEALVAHRAAALLAVVLPYQSSLVRSDLVCPLGYPSQWVRSM